MMCCALYIIQFRVLFVGSVCVGWCLDFGFHWLGKIVFSADFQFVNV
jgi:hypothetical protein